MWLREGVSVVALLLVLSSGLLEVVAQLPLQDGVQLRSRPDNLRARETERQPAPSPRARQQPASPARRDPQSGPQGRSPQRNLIQRIEEVIKAPYTGPVVTSMSAFLSRNSLSRPVRESIRQQLREEPRFNFQTQRGPASRFENTRSPGAIANSVLPRSNPSRPTQEGSKLQPFDFGSSSFEFSQPPSVSNPRKRETPSISKPFQASFIDRDLGQFQAFSSTPQSQPSFVRAGESNPFQPFRSNLNGDDGGFRVIDPPPRNDRNIARFRSKSPQSKSVSSSSSFINSDAPFTGTETFSTSPAAPFSFQNGVFSHQFESKRVKRNAKDGNSLPLHRDGRQSSSSNIMRRQSNSDQSYIGSIGSMFTRFTDSIPTSLQDVGELFGFETEDRIDTQSSTTIGKFHDRRRFDGRQPLPFPVSIPVKPAYMILPQHPVKHVPSKQRYKRDVDSDGDDMKSEPTRRVERRTRRPKRIEKSRDVRSIFRLSPIEISGNSKTGPAGGNIPSHKIQNLIGHNIWRDHNTVRSSLPVQLPPKVGTSFIHNAPNQLSGSPARLWPVIDTTGIRTVHGRAVGSPALTRPVVRHSFIHDVPNQLSSVPAQVRGTLHQPAIRTADFNDARNQIIPDKTVISGGGQNFNLITHKPKGIPPIETSSPAVIYNESVLEGREAPLVEVNFEDLPVLDHGHGNAKRLREIEEFIRRHNNDVNGVHRAQAQGQNDLSPINGAEAGVQSAPKNILPTNANIFQSTANPLNNVKKRQLIQSGNGLGDQIGNRNTNDRLDAQTRLRTEGATGFSDFHTFPAFPEFDFAQNFQPEFDFGKSFQKDFGKSFFGLSDVDNSIDITEGQPHDLKDLIELSTPSVNVHNDPLPSQSPLNNPHQVEVSQHTESNPSLTQHGALNANADLSQIVTQHQHSTSHPVQHAQQVTRFPQSLPIQHPQLYQGPALHPALARTPPSVGFVPPQGARLQQRTPHPTLRPHFGHPAVFHSRPLFLNNPHRRSKKSDGAATELRNYNSNIFIPSPARIVSVLPSVSRTQTSTDGAKKNRRRVRKNVMTGSRSGMKSRKRSKRNKRSTNPAQPELSFPQDLANHFFSESFDTPLAREGSDGFMQEQNPMPDFASLGGFGPMDEASQREASEFTPHFRVPVVEVAEENLEQPSFGPDSFPVRQDFPDQDKREKRSLPLSAYGRSVSDSSTSNSNLHQQPLMPFESFPAFNFPKFGERNSRELGGSPVSFSTSQHGTRDQRRHQAASTYQQNPSTRASPSTLRSRSGEAQQYHPRDTIYKAEGQRIYPSFNGGRSQFSRPAPAHTARSASNRRPFYPSQKLVTGPKSRSSTSTHNSLPNGFRDFHETFYGHRDKQRPGSHSHRQDDFSPVDNSLLGSGNFEVLSGGTFYEDDGGGGAGAYGHQRHPYDSFLDHGYPYNEGGHYNQPHSNNYVDDFFSNFRDFSEFAVRRSDREERDDFFNGHASENTDQIVPLSPSETKRLNLEHSSHQINSNNSDSGPETSASGHALHRPPRNIQEVLELEEAEPSNMETADLSVDETDPLIATF